MFLVSFQESAYKSDYYFCSKINATEEYIELTTKRGQVIIPRRIKVFIETKHKTKS